MTEKSADAFNAYRDAALPIIKRRRAEQVVQEHLIVLILAMLAKIMEPAARSSFLKALYGLADIYKVADGGTHDPGATADDRRDAAEQARLCADGLDRIIGAVVAKLPPNSVRSEA